MSKIPKIQDFIIEEISELENSPILEIVTR